MRHAALETHGISYRAKPCSRLALICRYCRKVSTNIAGYVFSRANDRLKRTNTWRPFSAKPYASASVARSSPSRERLRAGENCHLQHPHTPVMSAREPGSAPNERGAWRCWQFAPRLRSPFVRGHALSHPRDHRARQHQQGFVLRPHPHGKSKSLILLCRSRQRSLSSAISISALKAGLR